ncbi:MAG: hypothetical protein QOF73_4333 [Thermomicrobiales bacterium]|nr:hypothetical protein [Thermomicrobiales bacterium]
MKTRVFRFLSAITLVVLLVPSMGPTGQLVPRGASAIGADAFCAEPAEIENLRLVNELRVQHGLQPLRLGQRLGAAAEHHNMDMAANDFFSHTGSDGSSFVDRARAHGYQNPAGENIAAGQESARSAFEAWAGSAGHRDNMLNAGARWVGISRYEDTDGVGYRWYWAQVFGGEPDTEARVCGDTTTATPTRTPTPHPTAMPTRTPTTAPTHTATPRPTNAPTRTPTPRPTTAPTKTPRPTEVPTGAPTDTPRSTATPRPELKPFCHKGLRTLEAIPGSVTWNAHMRHGDTPGACPSAR